MNATNGSGCFRMKTINFVGCASAVFLAVGLTGCKEKDAAAPLPANKIVIKGSNTVGEELGPRLIAEYKREHPEVTVELESKGTGSGFFALTKGLCNIGAASRSMTKAEQEAAQASGTDLKDNVIGSYSVAVIVNAGSPIHDLTHQQVADIFAGAVQNWKDVGGPDAPIQRYVRSSISGTALGFQELAMDNKTYATNNTTALTNYTGIAEAVAKDPNGIGYGTIQMAAGPGVKGISIGGIAPTLASVKDGKYPYARVLHLYTSKATEAPKALEFVEFAQSAKGQQIVDEMGFVPRP
jgi:phosphate transport system substrate-binding protein